MSALKKKVIDGFTLAAEGAGRRSGNAPSEASSVREQAILVGEPDKNSAFIRCVVSPNGRRKVVLGPRLPNRLVGQLSG